MEILDKTGVSVLWSTIKDKFTLKSSLSKVATSGSYNDLSNKPAIPSVAGYLPLSGGTMTGALKIKGTAASKPLTVRGIVGCLEDGVTYDELHLQYGANAAIKLGNTASYSISADGSQYTGNAKTATTAATASAVAWANVTGKPTTFAPSAHNHGLNSSSFAKNVADSETGDWSSVGGNSGFLLMSLRSGAKAPNWLENNYSAGIAFGGPDTKGVISVCYRSPAIKIAGGNGTEPKWYVRLIGTSAKQYNLDSMPYAASAGTASAVAWANVTGKPSTYTPASHTHTLSQITDAGAAAGKNIRNLTTRSSCLWESAAEDAKYVPTMNTIAYWNGAYSTSGASNLTYCNKGEFGTIVTKNQGDYAAASHTHAWSSITGKPTMPTNITATAATIVSISGSTITVNASLDGYKTPGEYNIYGTSNGDYAKMYVQSGIADTFNGTRVITQTIRVTISHSTYAEVCDVTRQYKSNAWSAWTIMYLGND